MGIVLFILLSGSPPFYDDDNFELFEKIKRCEYDTSSSDWEGVSPEAKDLVEKLLVADPAKRLKCEAILDHPWIRGTAQLTSGVNVLDKMRKWNTKRKMELA